VQKIKDVTSQFLADKRVAVTGLSWHAAGTVPARLQSHRSDCAGLTSVADSDSRRGGCHVWTA
jgi:hypothetical protein